MLVLTGREMASLDDRVQVEYGLPGLVLMENAGREAACFVRGRYGTGARVAVVCGPGNNGGDGLVAGRHLSLRGHRVELWLGADEGAYRGDALANLGIAKSLGLAVRRAPEDARELAEALHGADVIVDAFFGTGFRGAPRPEAAAILSAMNRAGPPVVALDIPSGVEADTGAVHGEAVRAVATVTFALPKLGCLLHPGAGCAGELVVVPISLPVQPLAAGVQRFLIEAGDVRAFLPHRPRQAHKGLAGRVLIVGGSPGLTGAPFLAARGALRIGAGLATVLLPNGLPTTGKPLEVMTGALPADAAGGFGPKAAAGLAPWLGRADVLAAGPGMGRGEGAWRLLSTILGTWEGPLVLDADGLNLLAANGWVARPDRSDLILTPHPGEMARLCACTVAEVEAVRVDRAAGLARERRAVVVLKGVPTVVAAPSGRTWLNPTGDPAMAAGGMGDVLTGVIAGLIGQGLPPEEAAVTGVYLHGLAGELAAAAAGGPGILAGEVADLLPAAARKVNEDCATLR